MIGKASFLEFYKKIILKIGALPTDHYIFIGFVTENFEFLILCRIKQIILFFRCIEILFFDLVTQKLENQQKRMYLTMIPTILT